MKNIDFGVNRIFARTNAKNVVVKIFSEAFEQPSAQDICIDATNTERHGANVYQVYDDVGIANYAIVNGVMVERDKSEELYRQKLNNYSSMVESKIRRRYSVSNELAILRQRNTKPDEYQEYYSYCEQCKAEARQEIVK